MKVLLTESCLTLCDPIVARQAPLSIRFSRQEYCNGLPFPPSGGLLHPGMEPKSVVSPALADGFFPTREVAQSCPTLWTPWTLAYQAPSLMGFSRQECWSGLPFPSPGDLPDPEMELASPGSPALARRIFTAEPFGKPEGLFRCRESAHTL